MELPALSTLIIQEIRSVLRSPTTAIASAIIATPAIFGYMTRASYTLVDELDLFSLMLSNLLPLTFPLLVVALYLPRVSDEFSNNFVNVARVRSSVSSYLGVKVATGALVAFVTFSLAVLLAGLLAFWIDPALGLTKFRPEAMGMNQEALMVESLTRYTFSQLLASSPLVYCLVYAAWVGLNAAIYIVLGLLALALIENRFVALAAPFLVYQLANFTLAVLGFEEFGISTSIFPFSINQQPMWHPVVPLAATVAVAAIIWSYMRFREFDTSGLT
jgi:hypothetical protein